MDKDDFEDDLQEMIAEFASQYPQSALAFITGIFVGLLEYNIEAAGGDPSKEIKIDSGGKRDITIAAAA